MANGVQFTVYELKSLKRGEIVEVTLKGNAANVRLMDQSNLSAYKAGRRHRYVGGLVKRSPHRMAVPSTGLWYVTVDMGGLGGTTRSSVRVLPGVLPTARQSLEGGSLEKIALSESPALPTDSEVRDVFISHASEDKAAVARPLADALIRAGVSVWLDDYELRIGDSLRRKIDNGLAQSRFAIVVMSHSFFAKRWPQYELDGIVSRSVSGAQRMLPIWHEITEAEIMAEAPWLVDKIARSTAQYTIEQIAVEIAGVVLEVDSREHE